MLFTTSGNIVTNNFKKSTIKKRRLIKPLHTNQ